MKDETDQERGVEYYTTGNACDDEPEKYPVNNRDPEDAPELPWDFPTKSADDIDPRTLEMIERGLENMRKGNVSDPIDVDAMPNIDSESEDIDDQTLEMIDKGMEELKKGNTSGPIDMKKDFPDLFDNNEQSDD